MYRLFYTALALHTFITLTPLEAHDSFEITLEIQEKRNSIEAHLEMARSTAVAACDPAPSNGVLFDPADFPLWEKRFLEAAPELLQILSAEGKLKTKSIATSLNREDDVSIKYVFLPDGSDALSLNAAMLNRFPPDGFGVRVTFRDKSGHWYPPFMIFVKQQKSSLPPQ